MSCLTVAENRQPFLRGTQAAFASLAQIIMLLIDAAPIGQPRGIELVHELLQIRHPLGGSRALIHTLLDITGVIVESAVKVLHQLGRHHFV